MTQRTHPDELAEMIRAMCEEQGTALCEVSFLSETGKHSYGTVQYYSMTSPVPTSALSAAEGRG